MVMTFLVMIWCARMVISLALRLIVQLPRPRLLIQVNVKQSKSCECHPVLKRR
jgi:hypothetical protein